MDRLLLLMACAAAVTFVPAAHAGVPPAPLPDGRAVDWPVPSGQREATVGSRLTVRVIDATRDDRALTLTFFRAAPSGRPIRTLRRKRLRRGSVTFRVPDGPGRRYGLRLLAGSRSWTSYVRAVRPPVLGPPPAKPPATPLPCPRPGDVAGVAELTVNLAAARRRETLATVLRNTGPSCLSYGLGFGYEQRQADGTWARQTFPRAPAPAIPLFLRPGQADQAAETLPADLTDGTYRLVKGMSGGQGAFDVVSPPFAVAGTAQPAECPGGGTLEGGLSTPATVRRNEDVPLRLTNTGTACLTRGDDQRLERRADDGTWAAATRVSFGGDDGRGAAPGASDDKLIRMPFDLPDGTYRLTERVTGPTGELRLASPPFTVAGSAT